MKTKALASPYIVWMLIFTIVPLAMVFYFAFTTNSGEFTFTNMARAAEYLPVLMRSVWYALAACVICLLIGYPVAYVIAQTSARSEHGYADKPHNHIATDGDASLLCAQQHACQHGESRLERERNKGKRYFYIRADYHERSKQRAFCYIGGGQRAPARTL